MSQYLKALRLGGPERPPQTRGRSQPQAAPAPAAVLEAIAEQEPTPLVEQYQAAVAAREHAEQRLAILEETAAREMLSLDQEAEVQLLYKHRMTMHLF